MDTSDYQIIRQLFDDYLQMYSSRDDRLTSFFSDDFSGITGSGDFLVKDREEWVSITRQDFAQVKDPIRIELKDLAIQSLADSIAVATSSFTIHLPIKDNVLSRKTARLVLIFRKESAGWKISHSSISIPFGMAQEGEVYPLTELEERNQYLEELIAERTTELSEANNKLQKTMGELERQNEELRTIQSELLISRARYIDLYSLAPVGYLTLNEQGLITEVNLAVATKIGMARKDLLNKPLSNFVFHEDQGIFSQISNMNCEIRLVLANGSFIWVNLKSSPGLRGECGIALIDITERKLTEEALIESESTFRAHVNNSFDVIFTLDAAGTFVFVSPAWERHFGYPASEVMGRSFALFVHPDDIKPCVEYLTQILSTGQSATSPAYRVKCADGSLRSFIANGSPYTDTKGRLLFIGVGHDISDQLQAEQDRLNFERQLLSTQKLESLGVLAGGIAHDFNNLLQIIQGNMEMVSLRLSSDSGAIKYVEQSMLATKRATDLTNQMLAYSGKGNYTVKKLDINDLINENAAMFRTSVSRTISMDLHCDQHLPTIFADVTQLLQVIMNLIINASEAIVEQPGIIKLSTGVQYCDRDYLAESRLFDKPQPGRFVYLEVIDNGIGMNEETQARIFDPFFTTKFTGRGLGMSAVLGIVKGHGGALFVKSSPGNGSAIKVVFPALESDEFVEQRTAEILTAEKSADAVKPLSGLALVVDDEKNVLKIIVKMVELCGFTVINACDGVDAVRRFKENSEMIDVVLMDLTMPKMDGITAMREMRLIKPEVKIIISSGFNEQEFDGRYVEQSPSGFIRKPYSLKVVEAELRNVIQS
jgi:PAS domain S-box-containing protein